MSPSPNIKSILREYLESLVVAILVAIIIRSFILTAYKIPTSSMQPTLKVGDFIFAYKLPFGVELPFSEEKWVTGQLPKRGEIVVFRHPKDRTASFIKRVVGLPGDRIEIKNGQLIVNQVPVPSELVNVADPELPNVPIYAEKLEGRPFAVAGRPEDFGPVLVPPKQVFMLGDLRSESEDSRTWGAVPVPNIEGRVVLVWMSLKWAGEGAPVVRWERIFKTPN
jgi:signal peptidase I